MSDSLRGHLLIASPGLMDPNFHRTVVLLVEHDGEGAFGLVINRPSRRTVAEIWKTIYGESCERPQIVSSGGPVASPLMALLINHNEELGRPVVPGLSFTADEDDIRRLVEQELVEYRLFVGYAGWGSGQLEGEIEEGSWLTLPAAPEHVTGDLEELWRETMKEIGRDFFASMNIAHIPDDASLN